MGRDLQQKAKFTFRSALLIAAMGFIIPIAQAATGVAKFKKENTAAYFQGTVSDESMTALMPVAPAPVACTFCVSFNPASPTVCVGGSTTVTATPVGTSLVGPNFNYVWSNGIILNNSTTGSSTTTLAGTYTVTVTDNGSTFSTTGTVVIATSVPTVNITDNGTPVCQPAAITLTANATGGTSYTYLWSDLSSGSTTSVSATGTASYSVTITNQFGCNATAGHTVTVNPQPSASIAEGSTINICAGGSKTLTALPSSGCSYTWSTGAHTPTISVNATGSYDVNVTDVVSGCVKNSPVTVVTVRNLPVANIAAGSTTSFCSGGSVGLSVTDGGGSDAPFTYTWSNGAATVSTLSGFTASPTVTTTYTVTLTSFYGCAATSSTVVTVYALPVAKINGTQNTATYVCNSSLPGLLTATDNGAPASSYLWTPGGAVTPTVAPAATNTYTVTITNAAGCSGTTSIRFFADIPTDVPSISGAPGGTVCTGYTATLTAVDNRANGDDSYSWSKGAGVIGTTVSINDVPASNATTTYTVTITNACGSTTASANITVFPVMTASIANVQVCTGATATITPTVATSAAAPTYLWTGGSSAATFPTSATGTYFVTITDGCTSSVLSAIVSNYANFTTTIGVGPSATFCNGGSATLTANPTGTFAYNYAWGNTGTALGLTTPSITATAAGTYTVTVTSTPQGCTATSSQVVVVNTQPTPTITITSGTPTFCQGTTVTLDAGAGTSYNWNSGATSQTIIASATGTFTVLVHGAGGCGASSAPYSIFMNLAPTPTITSSTPSYCNTNTITLNAGDPAGTSPSGTYNYTWSVNGSTASTIGAVTPTSYNGFTAINAGNTAITQNYSVTITNDYGCGSAASGILTINPNATASFIAPPTSSCSGQVVTLNANTGTSFTYLWSSNGTTNSNTSGTASTTFTAVNTGATALTTTYTVTVTDACGNTATSFTQVTINPVITGTPAVLSSNSPVCSANNNVNLSATPTGTGFTYKWSDGASTINTTGTASATFTATLAGTASQTVTYTVTITDACNTTRTATTPVVVFPATSATITGPGGTICGGATVTFTANTGSGYTYKWTDGTLNSNTSGTASVTFIALNASTAPVTTTYTVTVTDNCLNTATSSVQIIVNPVVTATTATLTTNSPVCSANNNVNLSALPTGTGFTYNWSNGASTINTTGTASATFTATLAGTASQTVTYTVTITDACNNTNTATNQVVIFPAVTATITPPVGNICIGSVAALTASPGAGYTYTWNDGGSTTATGAANTLTINTTASFANATYVVTITDNCGSKSTASTIVTVSPTLISNNITAPLSICAGSNVNLSSTTLGLGFTYVWGNGVTTQNTNTTGTATFVNVTIGGTASLTKTYSVTITDACGNKSTNSIGVAVFPKATATITVPGGNICTNAGIALSANVGSGFLYLWSDASTTANSNDVTVSGAGTFLYAVTVTDNCGSTATASATITVYPTLPGSTISGPATICGGNNVNLSSATVGNGFTYNWSSNGTGIANTSGTPSQTYVGVANTGTANVVYTYIVTVTDACGSASTSSTTVTVFPGFSTAAINSPATVCNGANAVLTPTIAGGSGTYTYLWTGGTTNSTLTTGVIAGLTTSYTVTVSDGGCSSTTLSATISQYPVFTATINIPASICNGGMATLTPTLAGGNSTYTYNWSGGTTGTSLTTGNGTYSVTVTDGQCGSSVLTKTISQYPAFAASINSPATICNGATTILTPTLTGGNGTYTYNWSGGTAGATLTTGVSAGLNQTYTVTVTDGQCGTSTLTSTISQYPAFTVTTGTVTYSTCAGNITPTVAGGSGTYTYIWSQNGTATIQSGTGITTSTGAAVVGLVSATYYVTITDNQCGNSTTSYVVNSPAAGFTNTISAGSTTTFCQGGQVTLTAVPTPTAVVYTYSWNDGAVNFSTGVSVTVTPTVTTTYKVVVTNPSGCMITTPQVVTVLPAPTVTLTPPGGTATVCQGSVQTISTGTCVGCNYNWSTGATLPSINASTTGTFNVAVQNTFGCIATSPVFSLFVSAIPASTITIVVPGATPTCSNTPSDIKAADAAANGSYVYTYAWNNGNTNAQITASGTATYVVTITNQYGCASTASKYMQVDPMATATITGPAAICNGSNLVLTASPGIGYSYHWSGMTNSTNTVIGNTVSPTNSFTFTGVNNSTAGVVTYSYTVTVTDFCGQSATSSYTVNVNPSLTGSITPSPKICNASTGTITAVPSGGSGGYVLSWSPGGVPVGFGLTAPAGTYTVTVTDGQCGSIALSATITQYPAFVASIASPSVCIGTSVTITPTVAGGSGTYTYSWSDGSNGSNNLLGTGSWFVTVTDLCGSSVLNSVIGQYPTYTDLITTSNGSNYFCQGGSVDLTATPSPVGTYTYSWSDPNGSAVGTSGTITATVNGVYVVTVTNSNACKLTDSYSISVVPRPTASITPSSNPSLVCQGNSITLTAVTGANYSYNWSTGVSGGTVTSISVNATGTYNVVVTNTVTGCGQVSNFIVVTVNPLPTATMAIQGSATPSWCSNQAVNLNVTGSYISSYAWSTDGTVNGNITATYTPATLATNTYTVTVTSGAGCTAMASQIATIYPSATATIAAATNPICAGNNVNLSANAATSYTYSWSSNGTGTVNTTGTASNTFTNVPNAGPGASTNTYTVTITDACLVQSMSSVTVTVNPSVAGNNITPAAAFICSGNNVVLSSTTVGTSFTYQWSSNGTGIVSTSGTASKTFTNVTNPGAANITNTYTVTITDACLIASTNSTTVTIYPAFTAAINSPTVICNGATTTLTPTLAGGNGTYTYNWSGGTTGATLTTGVIAGLTQTYNVTVTDGQCGVSVLTTTISQYPLFTAAINSPTIICNGATTILTPTLAGGNGTYTYNWSGGTTGATLTTGVIAGLNTTYNVTVTDGQCGVSVLTSTISQYPLFTAAINSPTIICHGATTILTPTLAGGNGTYTYNWSGGTTAATLTTGVSAGLTQTYNVTVTDGQCGVSVLTSTISQYPLFTAAINSPTIICHGATTILTPTLAGGNGTYTYNWSGGTTGATLTTGVIAGLTQTYNVTVTDGQCGVSVLTSTISQYPLFTAAINSPTIICNGATTILTPTLAGGNGTYTYNWSGGTTGATLTTGVIAGLNTTYNVTVTDGQCGVSVLTSTISQYPLFTAAINSPTIICNGATTILTPTLAGGNGTYTYNWSGGTTAATLTTGVSAGLTQTYNVTVTDGQCGVSVLTSTISQYPLFTAAINSPTIICHGATTILTPTLAGGNGTYTYNWSGGTTAATLTTGVSAGLTQTYNVTVTDGQCGVSVLTSTISQYPLFTAAINSPTIICHGATTILTPTLAGGNGTYTYNWSGGTTGATLTTGVSAGLTQTYNVTVTDGQCGVSVLTSTISQYPLFTAAINSPTTICHGATTILTPTLAGGNGTYTYNWSGGTTAATLTTGVSAGLTQTYNVTVTDGQCGVSVLTSTISQYPLFTAAINSPTIICHGATTILTPTLAGGNGTYTYNWSGGTTAATLTTGVSAGLTQTYNVTVTDGQCGVSVLTSTISQYPLFTAAINSPTIICHGATTIFTPTLAGGNGTYTYNWSGGTTGATLTTGVSAGLTQTYNVTVTDGQCGVSVLTSTISQYPLFTAAINNPATICKGATTTLTPTLAGGNGTYTYNWSGGTTGATLTTGVSAGLTQTYNVTVTDGQCGVSVLTSTISQYPLFTAAINSPTIICHGATTIFTPTLAGGNGTYTYNWSGGTTGATLTTGVSAGLTQTYNVTVTDGQCGVSVLTSTISQYPLFTAAINNPAKICNGATTTLTPTLAGGNGTYTYNWSGGTTGATLTTGVSAGLTQTYNVTVTDGQCGVSVLTSTISQYPLFTAAINSPAAICNGGTATLTPTLAGGNGTYTYNWSGGTTGATLTTGVSAGLTQTYNVTVTDGQCGVSVLTSTISQYPVFTATINTPPTVCKGASTTLTATPNGGKGNYTYNWSNGSTNASLTTGKGTYTVLVTDAQCGNSLLTQTINEYPQFVASVNVPATVCNGGTTPLTVNVNGGSGTYSYNWNDGSTTSTITKGQGFYSVVVSDNSGCGVSTLSLTVNQYAIFTASINAPAAVCHGATAVLTAAPSGGKGGYTYKWSDNSTNSSLTTGAGTGLSATYSVTVTDGACGSSVLTSTISQYPAILATINTPAKVCNGVQATLVTTVSGGSGSYGFLWSGGATGSSLTTGAGNYSVTITDAQCGNTVLNATISQYAVFAASINNPATVCKGGTATLTATPTGGSGTYTYNWSDGSTGNSVTKTSGNYTVNITDAQCGNTHLSQTISEYPAFTASINAPATVCTGGTATLTATVNGGSGNYSYLWTGGSTGSSLTTGAGNYIVNVTDNNACGNSILSATISAYPVLTATINTPSKVCNGGTATLLATVNGGSGSYSYNWSNGATGNTTTTGVGTYNVTITDNGGCGNKVLTQTISAFSPLVASISNSGTICNGGSATITATVTGGSGTYTYNWSNGSTTAVPTLVVNAAGTYNVTVDDNSSANCFIVSNSTTVINGSPAANIATSGATTFCAGGNVTLTASGGATYLWSTGATAAAIVANSNGTYIVTVTNGACTGTAQQIVTVNAAPIIVINTSGSTIICVGDSVKLTATGGNNYSWSFGGTVIANTAAIEAKQAGNYDVNVFNAAGCNSNSSISVNVKVPPTAGITANGATSFCSGDSVTLTAVGNGNYLWSTGATIANIKVKASGAYTVSITNSCGTATAKQVITVVVNPLVVVGLKGSSEFCQGDSAILSASYPGAYKWSNGLVTTSIVVKTSGIYSVSVTDASGCVATSEQIPIQVDLPPPAPIITVSGNILTSTGNNGHQWYLNDVMISGGTDFIQVAPAKGKYKVVVTDANGCTAVSAEIFVDPSGISSITNSVSNVEAYPNPFSDIVTIKYWLTAEDKVSIELVDVTGKLVAKPVMLEPMNVGEHEYKLDASDYNLKQGLYILKVITGKQSKMLKLNYIAQ